MPRSGDPRPSFTMRLSEAGREAITARAKAAEVTDGEMARWMLDYAIKNMPARYRPKNARPEKRRPDKN